MHNSSRREVSTKSYLALRSLALISFLLFLSACASTGSLPPGYVYNEGGSYVRVVPIESGAPDNSHPQSIRADVLRDALKAIKVAGTVQSGAVPMFAPEELEQIVPVLAAALEKAGPREDVTFSSGSNRGFFGSFSPKSHTTGRLFVTGQTINLIFGVVHEREELPLVGATAGLPIVPGKRAQRIEDGWTLVTATGRTAERRGDWWMIEKSALPTAAAVVPAPSAPAATSGVAAGAAPMSTAEERVQEIETKMRVLDQLKAKGLITDEEYRERRRVVLQGI